MLAGSPVTSSNPETTPNRLDDHAEGTPSIRLLQAIELLGRQGAMTYKELASALAMSKTATWRLVATLRDANWVCVRHGGTSIQLDPRLDLFFSTASFADSEFSELGDDMAEVAKSHAVHVDLFCPGRNGALVLHDTTRRMTVSAPGIEVPDDTLILAMHAAMTPPQLERYAAQVKMSAEPALAVQRAMLTSRRRIQQFPGYAWGADGRSLVVSIRGRLGTAAAIRLAHKSASARRERLIDACNDLMQQVSDKVEAFGSGAPIESVA